MSKSLGNVIGGSSLENLIEVMKSGNWRYLKLNWLERIQKK
jgi:hypothetical protein